MDKILFALAIRTIDYFCKKNPDSGFSKSVESTCKFIKKETNKIKRKNSIEKRKNIEINKSEENF